jgi:hypothetical protein
VKRTEEDTSITKVLIILLIGVFVMFATVIICECIVKLKDSSFTVKIEMDNNTLQAIKEINFTRVLEAQKDNKIYDCVKPIGLINYSNYIVIPRDYNSNLSFIDAGVQRR